MPSVNWSSACADYLRLGAGAAGTSGALLASIGGAVQGLMERYISRTFDAVTYTAEAYDGNDRQTLYLRHDPVTAVSSLTIGGTAVPSTDYVIHANGAAIKLLGGVFHAGTANVLVTYTAGLSGPDGPPPELVQAGVSWVAVIWKDRDRSGISSESAGGQNVTFTREMPPITKIILDKWKRGYVPSV